MHENHLPLPPSEGEKGYWLKRGDQSAETQEDVCYCANRTELELAKERFQRRGIVDFIVQAHVEGDLIKFYGVEGTNFFRCFYPCDDGETKFGAEQRNGISHHFSYSKGQLQHDAEQLSRLLQTPIIRKLPALTQWENICAPGDHDEHRGKYATTRSMVLHAIPH